MVSHAPQCRVLCGELPIVVLAHNGVDFWPKNVESSFQLLLLDFIQYFGMRKNEQVAVSAISANTGAVQRYILEL